MNLEDIPEEFISKTVPEEATWKNWSVCPMALYCQRTDCNLQTEDNGNFEPKFAITKIKGLGKIFKCLSYVPIETCCI